MSDGDATVTIKISKKAYVELLKLKAELTIQTGEIKTFSDAVEYLLELYYKVKGRRD